MIGDFQTAISDNHPIPWVLEGDKFIVHLLIVSIIINKLVSCFHINFVNLELVQACNCFTLGLRPFTWIKVSQPFSSHHNSNF